MIYKRIPGGIEIVRLFVAIDLSPPIKEDMREAQAAVKATRAKVTLVDPSLIHITLKFLGEINESQIENVKSAINSSIKGITPFNVSISEFGAFPDFRRPKVLWLGVKEGREESTQLMINLENEFSELGFAKENRKPTPHITIGRVKVTKSLVGAQCAVPEKTFLVKSIYLIKSSLTSEGPIYSDLVEFNLITT